VRLEPYPRCDLNPINIASGPTVADSTTCADALDIVKRYGIDLPAPLREVLESGRGESIKPGDARLANTQVRTIATPQMALEAAANVAREVGKVLAGIALQVAQRGQPFHAPCVLLSGGETTVAVRGDGSGGRNVECLLAMGIALGGHPR